MQYHKKIMVLHFFYNMKEWKVLLLIFTLSATSCASFNNNIFNDNSGSTENQKIEVFNGKFSIIPDEHFGDYNPLIAANKDYYTLLQFLSEEHQKNDSLLINSLARFSVFDDNTLLIHFIQGKSITDKFILKGKLRSNGYFYLDEKEGNCIGIPYFFGGCYQKKMRIGIDKRKNLLIQVAEINKGALLFIFFKGYAYNMAFSYKRLSEN